MVGAQPAAAISADISARTPYTAAPDDLFNVNGHQAAGAFIVAVHAATGNLRWRYRHGASRLDSAPAVRGGEATGGGRVGGLRWLGHRGDRRCGAARRVP